MNELKCHFVCQMTIFSMCRFFSIVHCVGPVSARFGFRVLMALDLVAPMLMHISSTDFPNASISPPISSSYNRFGKIPINK